MVHYHMFKNAGSSVDVVLERNLGNRLSRLEANGPYSYLRPQDILHHALSDEQIMAITTHTARLPAPIHAEIVFMPFFMLRHPIDRLRSAYEFSRRRKVIGGEKPPPLEAMAQNLSFPEYVSRLLKLKNGFACNFQTTHLSQAHMRVSVYGLAKAEKQDLDEVMTLVGTIPCVGIVERFEESMILFERVVARHWPAFHAFGASANKSAERADSLAERLDRVAEELGCDLHERLLAANRFDLDLLEFAERRLDILLPAGNDPPIARSN